MNKQIEEIKEMARAIYETGEAVEEIDLRYACLHGADSDSETKFMRIARHLYHNDYRKSTDVAREIFAEIDKLVYRLLNDVRYIAGDLVWDINELKKKYESEGAE